MIRIEACISADFIADARQNARAAFEGGATTIELCRDMRFDGLTPSRECIEAARQEFKRPGLMVMIRPRKGDFVYSERERDQLKKEIGIAADAGADGVVLGMLTQSGELDLEGLKEVVPLAKQRGLTITFHRALDAAVDRLAALEQLIEMGFDRILVSGVAWGEKGTALDGLPVLKRVLERSEGRLEVVIAGSINPDRARKALERLKRSSDDRLSLHAYSGVQENGRTTAKGVRALVDAVAGD